MGADANATDILALRLTDAWEVQASASLLLIGPALVGALLIWVVLSRKRLLRRRIADFELDAATLGIGSHRFSFKPNDTDRQIAYSIWVELSTRKIGLPLDLEHDVISEIYDSWYAFFGITRELLKSVPITQVRRDSTNQIVQLSVEVLNEGLRPHLTRWQARYRAWLSAQPSGRSPQEVQKDFPEYAALRDNMLTVNAKLIAYRDKMHELAVG